MGIKHNKDREALRANNYTTKQAVVDVRDKVLRHFSGSLATICRDEHPLAGYPVCSVVPFALDDQYCPIILIANVAEHTGNARFNPKASIFLRERDDGGDVQTQWRICMIGDLTEIPEDEVELAAEKYFAYYPQARNFDRMHDFHFFRLKVRKYRVIMGFGDIRWVAGDAPFAPCPFNAKDRERMITHMNEDHHDAMLGYLRQAGITIETNTKVMMTDINQYGFVLRNGAHLYFLPYAGDEQPQDAMAVRKALVAMAQAS